MRASFLLPAALLLLSCAGPDTPPAEPAERSEPPRQLIHLSTEAGDLPAPGRSTQQTASLVLDADGDGVNDFAIGCRQAGPCLVVYIRRDGGWQRLVADSSTLAVEAGGAAHDIDGDGDLDIVMGGDASSSQVWWWENPSPDFDPGRPWTRRSIKDGGGNKHHDQIFGDFDGDGDTELVFWNQKARALLRADIPADPRSTGTWPLDTVYSWEPEPKYAATENQPGWMAANEHEGLAAADIDLDGTADLVGGGRWFGFTPDGAAEPHVIDASQHFTRAAAGQLVPGGRPEVVFVIGDGVGRMRMYEWTGQKWSGRDLLGRDVWHGHSLDILDIDRDGNLDVFCAEMRLNGANPDAKIYALLGDGAGSFTPHVIADGFGNHETRAADLDGDGDIDVLGKPYNWRTPRLDIWLDAAAGLAVGPDIPFERIVIDEDGPVDPHTKSAGDIDGDGIEDLLICSSTGGPLVWYRSPGWERYQIAQSGRWSCDAELADVDGDGDNDVVISEYYGKQAMEWYENPLPAVDPSAGGWAVHPIGEPRAHDVETADLDGDGDMDFVGRGQSGFGAEEGDRLALWYNDGAGSFDLKIVECPHGEGLALGDVDLDGDPDIVIGGRWHANPGGAGGEWAEHVYGEWRRDAVAKVADINGDGRLDAILTEAETTGPVAWFECPADPSAGWTRHLIADSLQKGHSLGAADLDNDGDIDVVAAEMHQSPDPDYVLAFINLGGGAGWRRQVLGESGTHMVRLGDYDGDGDVDVYGANWQSVAQDSLSYAEVWRNNTVHNPRLRLDKWRRHVIDAGRPWRAVFIDAADMDGDSLPDVITGGWWYRNPGDPSAAWSRHQIGEPLRNMALVHDFDGDGRPDVLGTTGKGSEPSAEFVWARNTGGGSFDVLDNIPSADGDFLQGVATASQYAGSRLAVLLSWHQAGRGIQAFMVPRDPVSGRWEWLRAAGQSQDEQISAGDIDVDGDDDLLLGTMWLENSGGGVRVHTLHETGESPDRNRLADIDLDGRPDAVVGYEAINVPGKLAWYRNPDDPRGPWEERVIAEVVGPMSVDAVDMDGDGDIDVVVGEHNYDAPETARLLVFENTGHSGEHWRRHVVHTGDEHHDGAVTVDIDNDGDLDVISIGWSHPNVLLYENLAR